MHGNANVNKTTQELGWETMDDCGIEEDQDADPGCTTTAYIHVRGSFKAPLEYLSANSVSSSNPTTAILVCVISFYAYNSG